MTTVDAPLPHLAPADSTGRPVRLVEIRRRGDDYPAAALASMVRRLPVSQRHREHLAPGRLVSIEAITLTSTADFQGFSRGTRPRARDALNTPAKKVADAVLATFPAKKKQSVLVS